MGMDAPSLPEGAQTRTVHWLILSGRLYQYLADLNDQAQVRLEMIMQQMKRSEGVDEKMKARDQMLWGRKDEQHPTEGGRDRRTIAVKKFDRDARAWHERRPYVVAVGVYRKRHLYV